jgi:hypothetical protein
VQPNKLIFFKFVRKIKIFRKSAVVYSEKCGKDCARENFANSFCLENTGKSMEQ